MWIKWDWVWFWKPKPWDDETHAHKHREGFKALVYKWDEKLVFQCHSWGTGALMCTVCLYAGQYLCYMSDLVD